jgi:hypothetical protein
MNKDIIKDLETVKSIFDKHGVRLVLVYGALLGHYRDGKFLPGDDDVDLAVIDKVSFKTRKDIGWDLYNLGFEPQQIGFNVFGRMEPSEIGYNGDEETGIIVCERNFKFSIFFFKEEDCGTHGKEFVCVPKLGALKLIATPCKYYKTLGEIKINKTKYLVPTPTDEYLKFTYGDWKDKSLRNHGQTYFEMHPEHIESINIEGKNEVIIYK